MSGTDRVLTNRESTFHPNPKKIIQQFAAHGFLRRGRASPGASCDGRPLAKLPLYTNLSERLSLNRKAAGFLLEPDVEEIGPFPPYLFDLGISRTMQENSAEYIQLRDFAKAAKIKIESEKVICEGDRKLDDPDCMNNDVVCAITKPDVDMLIAAASAIPPFSVDHVDVVASELIPPCFDELIPPCFDELVHVAASGFKHVSNLDAPSSLVGFDLVLNDGEAVEPPCEFDGDLSYIDQESQNAEAYENYLCNLAFDEVMHENFKPDAPDFEDDGLEDDDDMDLDYLLDNASMQKEDDGKEPDHVSVIETPVSHESAKTESAKPEALKGNRRVRVSFRDLDTKELEHLAAGGERKSRHAET